MLCNATAIKEYDIIKSELSNEPIDLEYGNNITDI